MVQPHHTRPAGLAGGSLRHPQHTEGPAKEVHTGGRSRRSVLNRVPVPAVRVRHPVAIGERSASPYRRRGSSQHACWACAGRDRVGATWSARCSSTRRHVGSMRTGPEVAAQIVDECPAVSRWNSDIAERSPCRARRRTVRTSAEFRLCLAKSEPLPARRAAHTISSQRHRHHRAQLRVSALACRSRAFADPLHRRRRFARRNRAARTRPHLSRGPARSTHRLRGRQRLAT